MTSPGYILAIDQGTTGTTALLVDGGGKVIWQSYQEITQIYPQAGWVEHDPSEIFNSVIDTVDDLLDATEISPRQLNSIGITNQRETTIIWERSTGKPVSNAIVWQCRRTAPLCDSLKARGLEAVVAGKTGLPIDAYFPATKIRWILDNIPNGQLRAERGELAFGTVDTWLLWNLTNGTVHATDVSNASCSMLYNINTLEWDTDLLNELNIPATTLPSVLPSSTTYGYTGGNFFAGQAIPIASMVGDQQAALFGQACFKPGMSKNTYGTGSFILINTGPDRVRSEHGLMSIIAWDLGDGVTYGLEGSIFSTGATVQWLRDGLQIIEESSDVEGLAASVEDNGGVYLVPAFTGLAAPHWDMYARGTIVGITCGTERGHIARAALESTAYQTRDAVDAMQSDTGLEIPLLRVDGGGTANDLMMQFQADILGIPIERHAIAETTALGAAYLAGLATGFWKDTDEIAANWESDRQYIPSMGDSQRTRLYDDWQRAVGRSKNWQQS
ncbi:MAG: glycerol kinase GlpK [Chloroflexi bacterium]|nr:glycerol kinase GlpK [Chloroflexota bacterium]